MIMVTDQAFSIGVTALPDPVTDVGDDGWLWFQSFGQRSDIALTAPASYGYPFDSKAKRVLPRGYTMAVVAANAHATHAYEFMLAMRVLSQIRGTG